MNRTSQHFKMSVLSRLMYTFNRIPIKISTEKSMELDQLIMKLIWMREGQILEFTSEEESVEGTCYIC